MQSWFKGVFTAIVTPFKDNEVDEKALCGLVERQIEGKVSGLVPCGTTGEAATMSDQERFQVIRTVSKQSKGRVPVIAGAGSNSTAGTFELVDLARSAGADGVLVVAPYYNKPTQQGLFLHYSEVCAKSDIPVMVYNVPGRTCCDILPGTMARLSAIDGVEAVKEACGSVGQISDVIRLVGSRAAVMSGDDGITVPLMSVGATGVVSVISNILPDRVSEMVEASAGGDFKTASKLHHELDPLVKAMFCQTNPIPAKTALSIMGLIAEEFRLPLCPMEDPMKDTVKEVLKKYGLVS